MTNENFTKKETSTLEVMMEYNKTSKIRAYKILDLLDALNKSSKNKQSLAIVRKNIKKLIGCGFISEGIKSNRYKTYYVTQDGVNFIHGLLDDAERGNLDEKNKAFNE